MLEVVRSRVFGIIAGYEDQNDHDALRNDAVFKVIADRLPSDSSLASQLTLSRFENAISPRSLLRLEDWFIERFVNSFEEPPREVTLDVDVFDDATHGQQQLTLFHGYYNQYQYLVRAITCAENDLVVLPVLLFGPAEARTGKSRRRVWNRRRQADPLGEGHAATWRMRLIKVAVRIRVTARRIRVFISGSWPFLDHFREVGRAVLDGS